MYREWKYGTKVSFVNIKLNMVFNPFLLVRNPFSQYDQLCLNSKSLSGLYASYMHGFFVGVSDMQKGKKQYPKY